jgi:hypothetical protein
VTPKYLDYLDFGRVETMIRDDWKWAGTRIEDPASPELDAVFPRFCNAIEAAIEISATSRGVNQDIRYCVLESSIINAVAFRLREDTYCIALTNALFIHLAIFGGLFEQTAPISEVFPHGNIVPALHIENFQDFQRENGLPLELQDQALARGISGFGASCLMAVAFHELGHIINGHCARHAVSEMDGLIATTVEPLEVSRALEFDADCFAVLDMIRFFHHTPRLVSSHLCKGGDDRLRFAILATFCAFGALGSTREYDPKWLLTNIKHPPPIDRMKASLACAGTIVAKSNPEIGQEAVFKELITPLMEAAASAYCLVTAKPYGSREMEVDAATYIEFSHQAQEGWRKARPRLLEAKLGNHNLAPADPEDNLKRPQDGPEG